MTSFFRQLAVAKSVGFWPWLALRPKLPLARELELIDMVLFPGSISDGAVERRQPYAPLGCVRSSRLAAASILGSQTRVPSKNMPPSRQKNDARHRQKRLRRSTVSRRLLQIEALAMKTLKTVETFRKEASINDAQTDDPERVFHADRKRRRRGCRAGAAARARQAVQQEGEGGE